MQDTITFKDGTTFAGLKIIIKTDGNLARGTHVTIGFNENISTNIKAKQLTKMLFDNYLVQYKNNVDFSAAGDMSREIVYKYSGFLKPEKLLDTIVDYLETLEGISQNRTIKPAASADAASLNQAAGNDTFASRVTQNPEDILRDKLAGIFKIDRNDPKITAALAAAKEFRSAPTFSTGHEVP